MYMKLIEYLQQFDLFDPLLIFILSIAPITELRLSIPYGILFTDLNWKTVYIISVIGNIMIGIFVLFILPYMITFISRFYVLKKIYTYCIKRTSSKSQIINNLKYVGLIIFVAVPLPFSGVWSGALASNILSLSKYRSIMAIIYGVLISSTIVTYLTFLGKNIFLK